MRKPSCAFIGFGEINTPYELITARCAQAREKLTGEGIDIAFSETVTDSPEGGSVKRAVEALRRHEYDCVIACVAGWIPTHAVIDALIGSMDKFIILWGLSGVTEGGRLVTTADQAGTTALRKVMEDMGFRFAYVYNFTDRWNGVSKIVEYAVAARAAACLKTARAGMVGYRDMKLYGTLYDAVSLRKAIGADIEQIELLELAQRAEKAEAPAVAALVSEIKAGWIFMNEADDGTLERGARYYLALKDICGARGYGALSIIDVDGMKKLLSFPPAMIFMLLSDKLGISTVPENDAPGMVTQLMARSLTGQIAAYLEFYEFMEDRVLMGAPDFVPSEIVDGDVKVMFTGFGGISAGVMNVSELKRGRVTLFRLCAGGGRYAMHIVAGEAATPRPWTEAGWADPAPQLPGLEIMPDMAMDDFARNVMSQHYILTYGDNAALMKALCHVLDIGVIC